MACKKLPCSLLHMCVCLMKMVVSFKIVHVSSLHFVLRAFGQCAVQFQQLTCCYGAGVYHKFSRHFHLVVQLVYGWCVKSGSRAYAVGSHCVSAETAQAHIRNILFFCTHLSCNCYCCNPSQLALCPHYTGTKNKINGTLRGHIGEFQCAAVALWRVLVHCCRSSTAAITLATCTSIAHTSSAMPGVCIMWHNSCMQRWQVAKVVVVMIAAS